MTSRNIQDRLYKELEKNLSLNVEKGGSAETFMVKGRGMLHLGILIENMRREGYEFAVGAPQVITKVVDGKVTEPWEHVYIEVPEEHVS